MAEATPIKKPELNMCTIAFGSLYVLSRLPRAMMMKVLAMRIGESISFSKIIDTKTMYSNPANNVISLETLFLIKI